MKLNHSELVKSLRLAYSAERAASFAYVGHAGSLRDAEEVRRVREIEQDEWEHRAHVLEIMKQYEIPVSRWNELKYYVVGKVIGYSCYVIGRFMPYFFAGKLESGNVCEYFVMIQHFHSLGITEHDEVLYEMGIKEKEHEVYFFEMVEGERWLPLFEKVFSWGKEAKLNDVNLEDPHSAANADQYCQDYMKAKRGG